MALLVSIFRNSNYPQALTSSPFPLLYQMCSGKILPYSRGLQLFFDVFQENSKSSLSQALARASSILSSFSCHAFIIIPNPQQKQIAGFFPNKNQNAFTISNTDQNPIHPSSLPQKLPPVSNVLSHIIFSGTPLRFKCSISYWNAI